MSALAMVNSTSDLKFPVHPEYEDYADKWERIRDAVAGSDDVKKKGVKYLPQLAAQKDKDYLAYKTRAVFLNTSARVLNTNVGTIVRRTPEIEHSKDMEPYFLVDTAGFTSFNEMFKFTVMELGSHGRLGMSAEIINNIPVPIRFKTENIVNWIISDDGELINVLLAYYDVTVDPLTFVSTNVIKYIRLYINGDGNYTVDKMNDNKVIVSSESPALRGKTLNFIPFVPLTPFGIDITPAKPPLLDVVDVNYSHYRTSADLETGRHFVGLPQPIVSGATAETALYVGSSKAWVLPNKDAKAYYLEFLGQGLDGLAKALAEKEGQMAQFSAQLTDTSTRGSEAEGTVRLRYSTDAANLSDIASAAELGLNRIYGIIAEWQGYERPVIDLNKDFF